MQAVKHAREIEKSYDRAHRLMADSPIGSGRSGSELLAGGIEAFKVEHRRLTNVLNVGHALGDAAMAEVIAAGLDVRDACVLLLDLYGGALIEFLQEHQALTAKPSPMPPPEAADWSEHQWQEWIRATPRPQPDWSLFERLKAQQESGRSWSSRLSLGFKTAFFFTRAYQDALCRVLLVVEGLRAGGYTSMNEALKRPANPMRLLLEAEAPDYIVWFRKWTALRDNLKKGNGFSFQLIDGELGVVFVGVPDLDGRHVGLTTHQTVFLSDVASALQHSGAAAAAVIGRASAGFDADALAYVERLD